MNRFLPLVAMTASALHLHAAEFASYTDTLAAAKQAKHSFVVLYKGPSWLPDTGKVCFALSEPATRAQLANVGGWAAIAANGLLEDELKKLKDKPDFTPFDLPALALVDAEGKTYSVTEGVSEANLPKALAAFAKALPAAAKRDELFAKARSAVGIERAKLFGQGLDQVAFRFSSKRKDILSEIKQADPQDVSGYDFKYTFDAGGFHEKFTQKLIREKKYDELSALVDKHLANPVLAPSQRQALLSAKMQVYRAQEDVPNAVAILRKIISIDPRSEIGIGAVDYIRLLTEPVRLRVKSWEHYDNRPVWLPMVVEVSADIKAPGTYEIEFKHHEGLTKFRKVTLKVGGKEIASEANASESRKVQLTVPASFKGGKIELWAESRGTDWFQARGQIVVTKVS